MVAPKDQRRKEAIRGLINIILFELLLIGGVIAIFLYTSSAAFMIGGVLLTGLIVAPMFIRWARTHGPALKSTQSSDTERR